MKKIVQHILCSLLLIAAFSFVTVDANAQGCVMCRAQVGEHKDKDEAKMVGSGLNTGILYLLAFPFALIGVVSLVWYTGFRKNQTGIQ
ncbi:hypothetical protein [Adhaeribacter soli]|uniref:Uncharacterized protein n=1 Tax=Adhaeribacter soli TaxID=2607655 RepID=A0A5N1IL86_9BACT|nr:hypothetical protein [Adhaeribacter soli]KAA9325966.1 hypothetical protein F0P94_16205 [Adhaeribacter soli]